MYFVFIIFDNTALVEGDFTPVLTEAVHNLLYRTVDGRSTWDKLANTLLLGRTAVYGAR